MLKSTDAPNPLERFLVILGAGVCLLITVMVWRSVSAYQAMWPLPGLYFIEMAALAIISALAFIRGAPVGKFVAWIVVGMFAAFCILGALSIGFLYLPVTFVFAAVCVLSDLRDRRHVATHLAVCLLAVIAQATLMLTAIRLLDPGGAF